MRETGIMMRYWVWPFWHTTFVLCSMSWTIALTERLLILMVVTDFWDTLPILKRVIGFSVLVLSNSRNSNHATRFLIHSIFESRNPILSSLTHNSSLITHNSVLWLFSSRNSNHVTRYLIVLHTTYNWQRVFTVTPPADSLNVVLSILAPQHYFLYNRTHGNYK